MMLHPTIATTRTIHPHRLFALHSPRSANPRSLLTVVFSIPSSGDVRYANVFPQTSSCLLQGEMAKFNTSFQTQLSFNFCATRASCRKSVLMLESCTSRLREIDLDLMPASFSFESNNSHELSQYVLEDLLSFPIGSHLIVCIRVGATGNPTEL